MLAFLNIPQHSSTFRGRCPATGRPLPEAAAAAARKLRKRGVKNVYGKRRFALLLSVAGRAGSSRADRRGGSRGVSSGPGRRPFGNVCY